MFLKNEKVKLNKDVQATLDDGKTILIPKNTPLTVYEVLLYNQKLNVVLQEYRQLAIEIEHVERIHEITEKEIIEWRK